MRELKQLQEQLDKSESKRMDWRLSYMKAHESILEKEQQIRKFQDERAKFLEHWYALSSETLADQRARRGGPPEGWKVKVIAAEAKDGCNES